MRNHGGDSQITMPKCDAMHRCTIAPKEHLRPTGMMFVRACVRACERTYVTLENIKHSISRGRIITKCWNLVCVCNKFQWWYSDLNIPGNSQQLRFSEFSIFLLEFDYFKSWVALISIFRSVASVVFLSRIVHSWLSQREYLNRILAEIFVLGMRLLWMR